MNDDVIAMLALAGCGLLVTALASQIFMYFIALTAPPFRRAAWTAGLGYWVATAAIMAWMADLYEPGQDERVFDPFAAPLYCLPSGLLALWFWYGEFRRTWVPDSKHVPKGARLMNSDWREGLSHVVALALVAASAALVRWLVGHR